VRNWIETQYLHLLEDILEKGVKKTDRTGTGTKSIFGYTIRHNMKDGFPLLTTKKMAWKTMVTELIWFLRGDTNIKYLVDNNCHIWDGDAYKNYKNKTEIMMGHGFHGTLLSQEEFIERIKTDDEFAKTWGELGPVYGKQWRSWREGEYTTPLGLDGPSIWKEGIDQIANLISELKTNPDSRRLMVNAWNVGELDQMVLPPCHYGFQVYTRELTLEERYNLIEKDKHTQFVTWQRLGTDRLKEVLDKLNVPTRAISLMYNCRSQDVPLGTPFNISSYALLLEIIAKMVNMVPDELIANMGDCHIYLNQIDGVKEQLTREPYPLPKLVISNQVNFNEGLDEFLNSCLISDFQLEGYQSHPAIKMPLSN
jgi:thymidylate synthase